MGRRMYRYTILLVLCAAMTVGARASLAAGGARADLATLNNIASRVDGRAGVISIEASDPVAYIASHPDPRLFVIELRDIESLGFVDNFKPDPRHPFVAVQVEPGQAVDGARVARVRIQLAQPMRPRVRSSRNVIYVEADRLDRPVSGAGAIVAAGPSSAIHDVRVARRGTATAVTLYGTGRLVASGVEESKEGPPRLVIDLPNATSALPGTVPVGAGPVEAVHLGLNADSPLITRVVMDLTRKAPYRLETSTDGNNLTVIFDEAPLLGPSASLVQGAASPLQAPVLQVAAVPQAQAPPQPAPLAPPAPPPAAAQPQPLDSTGPQPCTSQPAQYSGFPVSLDFQSADLRAVLRTFAEISGLNIVIGPTVQGSVDVALRDVPWDQALDLILRSNQLGCELEGTIVRIVPFSVLRSEQEERQRLADAQALAGELLTITRTLSYARAEQVQPLLTATVLSQRGSITNDPRTNTLIITDLAARLERATELIVTLDRPEPQVEIEARIVQTTRNFARELGVRWGFGGRAASDLANTLPLAFPNQVAVGGATGATQGAGADAVGTAVDLGVSPASSAIGLALGAVNGAFNLDVALSALEGTGQGRILSTPRVTTQNNIEAEITQGIQIPIQTVANNTVTVTFQDAALTLLVTPQITAVNTVIMRITVENAAPDFTRSINNIPPIDTQRAVTQVLVNDGETTVIGGIYVSNEQAQQDRTPGLYRIPLLGWLFQRNQVLDQTRELLIFITPRIIRLET